MKDFLIKELDRVFSIVVRQRYMDEAGFVRCKSCDRIYHWTQITCGHFRKRRHMRTRWHIKNAAPQCSVCNGADKDISGFLDTTFGRGTSASMTELSHKAINYSDEHLKEMIRNYTHEIK